MKKITKPTREEWQCLFDATEQFKRSSCWEWMYNDDIFAVQDPESKETAFVCIMGNGGEHFGIAGYLGLEGLCYLLELLSGEIDTHDLDNMFRQKCLICSLEDRNQLQPEDLKIIKDLGLKFRGRNQWPEFRHYEPGLVPWFLTASQCRFLTHIINQAIDVSSRCKDTRNLLAHENPNTFLTRVPTKVRSGVIEWQDKYIESKPVNIEFVSYRLEDEFRCKKLALVKPHPKLILEADTFFTPTAIKDNERPYYPKISTVVDHHHGNPIFFDALRDIKIDGFKSIESLANFIERNNVKPSKILVSKNETYYLYLDICNKLDIKLEMVEHLEHAENARLSMFGFLTQM